MAPFNIKVGKHLKIIEKTAKESKCPFDKSKNRNKVKKKKKKKEGNRERRYKNP